MTAIAAAVLWEGGATDRLKLRTWIDISGTVRTTRAQEYLYFALYAFALLGLELVLVAFESLIGLPAGGSLGSIVHWGVTIFLWVGGGVGLVACARRRTDFRLCGEADVRLGVMRWLAVAALIVLTLLGQWLVRGGVLPPVAEHDAFLELYGDAGTIVWLVQVLYYFSEAIIIALIIGFGQAAGERWFVARWMPWGGIMLALTWGLVHFLTQDISTGIYGIALSLVMGTAHVLIGKNLLLTYPILLVLFIV
ncbi:hypothetical protein [Arthrobacter antibioticus]|uniref:hypothetical protein n=1 Tax=Arthrobacter sp. H35-MC1 TaxID=3046203 RepID=UPI0024BA0E4E|nr:hypothetical protein [Arthrobacter sp. H35-MC1]MDJ0318854.1 hypothetical protein [Arthrobacter sp. H35-MC1]